MPKKVINQLTAAKLPNLTEGMHADGLGLYFQVTSSNAKSWIYRYKPKGAKNTRYLGLGSYPAISLRQARRLHEEAMATRSIGSDPIDAKRAAQAAGKATAEELARTFKWATEQFMATKTWATGADKWVQVIKDYAYPKLENTPIKQVDKQALRTVLDPLYATQPGNADRLRVKLGQVLDYAKANEWRTGDNPAAWKGCLDALYKGYMESHTKANGNNHHEALPFKAVAGLMGELKANGTMAAQALQFTILTATRTGETLQAKWPEFNLEEATWVIPPQRMKAGKEHRIPLSPQAVAILKQRQASATSEYVFDKHAAPLHKDSCSYLLKTLGYTATVHGMRSSFRDWVGEETNHPDDVAEAALAHDVRGKTQAAYQRGDLFKKRMQLMNDWANYVMPITHTLKVVA